MFITKVGCATGAVPVPFGQAAVGVTPPSVKAVPPWGGVVPGPPPAPAVLLLQLVEVDAAPARSAARKARGAARMAPGSATSAAPRKQGGRPHSCQAGNTV